MVTELAEVWGLLWPNLLHEKATAPGRPLNSAPPASGFLAILPSLAPDACASRAKMAKTTRPRPLISARVLAPLTPWIGLVAWFVYHFFHFPMAEAIG
jgi:hypothetical protein